MQTHNVISTPNIEGNISSCSTNVQTITSGRESMFKINYTTIATNNCTGVVEKYETYGYSPIFLGFWVLVLTLSLMILGLVKVWLTPKDNRNPYNYF